ncbi:MAG: ATPase [Cyclobacteriaceae bacterium]|nr:ATPase [Cyclobacteriaceae bacterium]
MTDTVETSTHQAQQIWMIDEADLFSMLETSGKECYGEKFSLWKEDFPTLRKLLIYFFADSERAVNEGLDLKKGIMLSGPVGCGKTSIMSLVRYFQNENLRHTMKPCREIVLEFFSKGFDTISKYDKSFHCVDGLLLPKAYCFDDLGLEKEAVYYGNQCDVMKEVILSRYDLFESIGMLTHFTTNLTPEQLEIRYGENIASRLEAMVNFVEFDKATLDKRRFKPKH